MNATNWMHKSLYTHFYVYSWEIQEKKSEKKENYENSMHICTWSVHIKRWVCIPIIALQFQFILCLSLSRSLFFVFALKKLHSYLLILWLSFFCLSRTSAIESSSGSCFIKILSSARNLSNFNASSNDPESKLRISSMKSFDWCNFKIAILFLL